MSETTENKETLEQAAEQVEATTEEQVVEETVEVDEKEAKIAELEAKLAEQEAQYLRLRADYDNLARRSRLDREASEKYRAQNILTDILPVMEFRSCASCRSKR